MAITDVHCSFQEQSLKIKSMSTALLERVCPAQKISENTQHNAQGF
jgi:hypothetical protein